jgi:hypothetical protein
LKELLVTIIQNLKGYLALLPKLAQTTLKTFAILPIANGAILKSILFTDRDIKIRA